jgi:hypothetical protein
MILLSSGFDELKIESDGNVRANENAAGFESGVPRQPEVSSSDRGGGRETDACCPTGPFRPPSALPPET